MTQPIDYVIGGTLESTDADQRTLLTQSAPNINEAPHDGLHGIKEGPGIGAMFTNSYNRYTSQGQMALAVAALNGARSLEEVEAFDPAYDPYAFYAQHKDEFKDLDDSLVAGHFDDIRSEAGFYRRAMVLRENDMLDKDIAAGGTAGIIVGFGASLFDVTNLIPLGGASCPA